MLPPSSPGAMENQCSKELPPRRMCTSLVPPSAPCYPPAPWWVVTNISFGRGRGDFPPRGIFPIPGKCSGQISPPLSCSNHWADGLLCPMGKLEEKPSPPGVCTVTKPCCISGHLLPCVEGMVLLVEAVCKMLSPSFFHRFLAVFARPLGRQREGGWYNWERRRVAVLISTVLAHGRCQAEGPGQGGKKEREKQ